MDVSVCRFDDVSAHAQGLRDWQQRYAQLSPGHYQGELVDLSMGDVRVFRETTNLALAQVVSFPDHQQHLMIPLSDADCGPFCRNAITLLPQCQRMRAGAPSNYDILVLSLPNQRYASLTNDSRHVRRLDIAGDALALLKQEWRAIMDYFACHQNDHGEGLIRAMRCKVEGTLALLEEQSSLTPTREDRFYHPRRYIVERCLELLEATPDTPLSLMALCQRLKISRRTLQYSFEAETGHSPLHYIRAVRLNAVRQTLLNDPTTTVTQAAAEQGMFHQSYFSRSYRRLFDERPSDTLKRAVANR
ncbi:helix-turn-helix domain-containing protein [Carnimonas bestiolae]|uniref:helix-turn-helix domain-containing protein n=1 Tax=Carnimonas bestiolae TaxID=3402172 RepID=UPI003EDBDCED